MLGGNSITPKDETTTKVSFPPVIGLVIGAFVGALTWLIFYCVCPKPAILDKILNWMFDINDAGRRPPRPPAAPRRRRSSPFDGDNDNDDDDDDEEQVVPYLRHSS